MSPRIRASSAKLLLLLSSLLAPPAAAGEVWILEEPPLGPFPTIQQAIDAASEGALLLVELDLYDESPLIDGKSLSIVGRPGPVAPSVRRTLRVRNLGPDQQVVVRWISVLVGAPNPSQSRVGPAARLENNLGAVRFEECRFAGGRTSTTSPWAGEPGLDVQSSTKVLLRGCRLEGGAVGYCSGCYEGQLGGDGLRSFQSAVALFDCELYGGEGSQESVPGGDGGHGARVHGYGIVASGTTMRGGAGGGGDYIGCIAGGDGGDGLRIVGAQAKLLDMVLLGGAGGWSICNLTGDPGVPIDATSSSVELLSGSSRSLSVSSLAPDGALANVQVSGVPGDRVTLIVAGEPGFAYEPALNGLWAIEPVGVRALLAEGTVPASGQLDVVIKVPAVASGDAHRLHFLQGVCRSTSGASFLTSPAHLWTHRPPLP